MSRFDRRKGGVWSLRCRWPAKQRALTQTHQTRMPDIPTPHLHQTNAFSRRAVLCEPNNLFFLRHPSGNPHSLSPPLPSPPCLAGSAATRLSHSRGHDLHQRPSHRISAPTMARIPESVGKVPNVGLEITSASAGQVAADVRRKWGARIGKFCSVSHDMHKNVR